MLEILQNIITGACYRADGEPVGRHEPALGIGTRGTLRWRLFTATPEDTAVSGWTACTAFASGTFGARCSGDADFIGTRVTKLKTALAAGAVTAIDVLTDLEAADVPASGELGFTDDAGNAIRLAYSARLLTADGMRFTVDAELAAAVSAGTDVEVPDAPFFTAAHNAETSAPATGIFDFDLAIDSAKLRRAAMAASGERLKLTLELLVYEISGNDLTERRRFFCRSAAVDLGILGRLPGTPPTPDAANALIAYLRQIAPDYLPHIGTNGHWFVGETDTGVAAGGGSGGGTMTDTAVTVTGGTATIAAVEGGKRYLPAASVNKLVVGSVAASPQESEIVFEGEGYLVEATRAEFWCKDMNATWRKFTLNKVSGTGNSRIFRATFTDEAPSSYGEHEDTIYTCELKMVSGVWRLHVSWAQYPFDEDEWEVDFEDDPIATGEGDLTYSTAAADTALESLTEPDDADIGGGLPQWHAFDLSVYPCGVGIETDTDAGEYREHIELNSSAYPVTVSLPLSLDVIAMPDFQDGCYIINIRNGIAVGAEYTPGVSA